MPVATPARCAALALVAGLAGCSSVDSILSGDKVDYRNAAAKTKPLEVPPDLTQLARDPRYAPQGGVVSAAATPQTPSLQTSSSALLQAVVPPSVGKVRVEKQGTQRWLVAEAPPEVVYPEIQGFWQKYGFKLTTDNPQAGVLETDWVENRVKLPDDLVRSTLGRLAPRLYDSGERDRFRVRLERGSGGTEIYVTHRGLEEIFTSELKDTTGWQPRDNDPQLEAEILTKMLVHLGAKEEGAKAAIANVVETPPRARALGTPGALEVDEAFDRAWRRVGLALDRSGYTVEDRDRAAGLFFIRYVDPKAAGVEEPNFFARLFGASGPDRTPVRYRVVVKSAGEKTQVSVQSSAGAPELGDAGKNIVARLVRELR